MEIILQPVASKLDKNTFYHLADDISREFENKAKVSVGTTIDLLADPQSQSAFEPNRNQWNSPRLLDCLFDRLRPIKDTKILVILDVDAYSEGLNFVFGEAFHGGSLGAIYLPRIRQEFYGLKRNDELFYERMVKECVHELGHIFGFNHCANRRCVMHFSNSLSDTDVKGKCFCDTCRVKKPVI
jgi:archaemetzincin